jgi:hypothetical protein
VIQKLVVGCVMYLKIGENYVKYKIKAQINKLKIKLLVKLLLLYINENDTNSKKYASFLKNATTLT